MKINNITVHQGFYGEVNRAHSCIQQSLNDPDLTSYLIAFTDRPAALPPGVNLLPYLSGSSFSKYYILAKTFSDYTASRAGMVFTHALIFNLIDIESFNDLLSIINLFVESVDKKNIEVVSLQLDISKYNSVSLAKQQPKYIQQILNSFISGVSPILFSGDILTLSGVLQVIWNSPDISSRRFLKFRSSFTISDIEKESDLTIVSIQKDFLPKWQGQEIIIAEDQTLVEITNHAEILFLGYKEKNPFFNFLSDLKLNLADIKNYGQYERLFNNFIIIERIGDANILRQDIRILSKISPSPNDGSEIKEKYIKQLEKFIKSKKDTNLKALRNINWSSFSDGEIKASEIVFQYVKNEIENINPKEIPIISELIDISTTEVPKNWWHHSIINALISEIKNQNESFVRNIWRLIDSSESTLNNLFSLISSINDCEIILRKYIPEKLRAETCENLLTIAIKNNWYLFHADILLKHHSIETSVEKQLELEKNFTTIESKGLMYLVESLSSKKLIDIAVSLNSEKLISLAVELIIKDVTLLQDINLCSTGWFNIWKSIVIKTKNAFFGLNGREHLTVFEVLDKILNGEHVDNEIISLITDTQYSDISAYHNRIKIWKCLNPSHQEKFLTATAPKVIESMLSFKIEPRTIEYEVAEKITSDVYMSKFLSDNRNNIDPVITIFSSFDNLKDNFLADYITYYRYSLTEQQAEDLGNIVIKKKYTKSARSIYEKARYNYSFNLAYEICKEIVSLNWLESLFKANPLSPTKYYPNLIPSELTHRRDLPTIVILTALKEEYLAVRDHLIEIVEADQEDTNYEAGIFEFNGREIAKIFIRECGAKNTTAAQDTERAIRYFKPDAMFFVGIAGSRKPNDFSIGDVIFPVKIYSYEGGKSEKDSFVARPDIADLTFTLLETAKKERRKNDWKILIKGDWGREVRADLGIIASGEKVIDHYDSEIGNILKNHYSDTSVVEMEGYGFAKAANRQGREMNKLLIGIVRGVSDIIEQPSKKKNKKTNDRRPILAKQFASDTAAAFTYWLIFKTYEQ